MKKSELIKIIKEEISNSLKEAPLFQPTENPLSPGKLSMGSIPKVQASASSRSNFPGTFTVSVAGMSFEQLKKQPKDKIVLKPKLGGFNSAKLSQALGGVKIGYTEAEADQISDEGPVQFLKKRQIVWVYKYEQ